MKWRIPGSGYGTVGMSTFGKASCGVRGCAPRHPMEMARDAATCPPYVSLVSAPSKTSQLGTLPRNLERRKAPFNREKRFGRLGVKDSVVLIHWKYKFFHGIR